jgi:hypothetical protein
MKRLFNRDVAGFLLIGVVSGTLSAATAGPVPVSKDQATLSSDEMEIIHNGSKTIFTGHVLLEKPPYVLKAHRMTRTQDVGLVEAEGRVVGTWRDPAGGRLEALGDRARYDPQSDTAELWTDLPHRVVMNWKDAKGSGHFLSDRAFLFVTPKRVRLIDHVTGHIVPTP